MYKCRHTRRIWYISNGFDYQGYWFKEIPSMTDVHMFRLNFIALLFHKIQNFVKILHFVINFFSTQLSIFMTGWQSLSDFAFCLLLCICICVVFVFLSAWQAGSLSLTLLFLPFVPCLRRQLSNIRDATQGCNNHFLHHHHGRLFTEEGEGLKQLLLKLSVWC